MTVSPLRLNTTLALLLLNVDIHLLSTRRDRGTVLYLLVIAVETRIQLCAVCFGLYKYHRNAFLSHYASVSRIVSGSQVLRHILHNNEL